MPRAGRYSLVCLAAAPWSLHAAEGALRGAGWAVCEVCHLLVSPDKQPGVQPAATFSLGAHCSTGAPDPDRVGLRSRSKIAARLQSRALKISDDPGKCGRQQQTCAGGTRTGFRVLQRGRQGVPAVAVTGGQRTRPESRAPSCQERGGGLGAGISSWITQLGQ